MARNRGRQDREVLKVNHSSWGWRIGYHKENRMLHFFFSSSYLSLYILSWFLGLLATVPSNPNGNGNGGLMGYSPGESISGCGSTGGQSNSFNT